jgi:tetratricopeptide (TPR) repeat protein
LVVALILIGSVALAAVVIWWATAQQVSFQYVLGVGFVVLGTAFTTLHLTLSDDFLRRHFGEARADQMRRTYRSGWVGVLLGAALLGLHYLDRLVQTTTTEVQFKVAFNRGQSAAKAGDWQTAADAFSEAIRLDPTNALAYHKRGVVYLHQGEQDRALADLSEAIRLDPNDALALHNRGVAYVRKEDYDRALTDFGEAIRLNPSYAKAYLARSKVYRKKGDDAQAKADQQKAAELDPSLENP